MVYTPDLPSTSQTYPIRKPCSTSITFGVTRDHSSSLPGKFIRGSSLHPFVIGLLVIISNDFWPSAKMKQTHMTSLQLIYAAQSCSQWCLKATASIKVLGMHELSLLWVVRFNFKSRHFGGLLHLPNLIKIVYWLCFSLGTPRTLDIIPKRCNIEFVINFFTFTAKCIFKYFFLNRFIRLLEQNNRLLRNYTQNIDTLEQVADIKRVIQCHGEWNFIFTKVFVE